MLRVDYLRENLDLAKVGLAKRGWKDEQMVVLEEIIALDDQRKSIQVQNDDLLSQRNIISKEIGQLFKSGKHEEANEAKKNVESLKTEIHVLEDKMKTVKEELTEKLLHVPNIPHPSVPAGDSEEDNHTFKDWPGEVPKLCEHWLPHWDLATKYDILDFSLGVKITGAGFPVFKGKGAILQRALINFFLNEATAAGYTEYAPPYLVNEASAMATGQLPDKEGQMYYVTEDDLYLIPTAEVPLTNIYRDEIVDEADMPIKITGYTPCFRREAGSYGADVKGLNRVHQFDKVEIVQLVHPDQSYEVLMDMVKHIEGLLTKLELPYRILRLCGGDLGHVAALTYDFETYSAAQCRWLEVSSVSNFENFQANRLRLRYKDAKGKKHLAHTLNGSALALARIIATILENNQEDKGIRVPEVLQPLTGFAYID